MRFESRLIGSDKVRKSLRDLEKACGLSTSKALDIAAKVSVETSMRNVQPFGNNAKAKKQGDGAVRGDLLRIFKFVPDSATGRNVVKDLGRARALHLQHRRFGSMAPRMFIPCRATVLKALIEEVQKRVGRAKSGYVPGARLTRFAKVPGWVPGAEGDAKRQRWPRSKWTISANPAHLRAKRVFGESGQRRVLRRLASNTTSEMKRAMKWAAKKATQGIKVRVSDYWA
jgi:hypothetical protein